MKVQVTESGNWRRTLEIEAPVEAVEERLQAAYKKYSKTLNLPGFRKGKIPVSLVRKQFGKSIQGEVVQEMVQEFYQEATKAEEITPISEAAIDEIDFEEGQPLVFKASVDIKPELELESYKGIQVTRPIFPVQDSHLESRLQAMQEENAAEQVVDRPAGLGDVVVADVQEVDENGELVEGRRQEDQEIRLGRDPEAPSKDLDNQLVGIIVGEDREIKLTHSENPDTDDEHDHAHGEEDDGGEEDQDGSENDPEHDDTHDHGDHDHDHDHPQGDVRFQLTVKEIRERILPELDDEFAKDVGEFDSLDALKEQIQKDLQEQVDGMSRQRLQENIADALIKQNEFEPPDSMVDNYLDNMIESYKQEHQGHDHDIDEEGVREQGRESAVRSIKRHLLLESIGDKENIEITEEDINKHLENLSARHNIEGQRLRQILSRSGQLEQIQSEIQSEKVFEFLIDQADVEDVEETTDSND